MPVDLGSLPTNVNQISNIILVTPNRNIGIKPKQLVDYNKAGFSLVNALIPPPTDSFFFHVHGEDKVTLTSDITDHFIEDNTALQDQISLKPEIINTAGFIGELNNVVPPALELLKAAADKLTTLDPFVPQLSAAAIIAFNEAMRAYAAAAALANAATSTFDTFSGLGGIARQPTQNNQQKAFNKFHAWWKARQLFQVQTPWAIFDDCAIQNVVATQEEDTTMISGFEVTFKVMRFTKSVISVPIQAGRAGFQSADESIKGPSRGTQTSFSSEKSLAAYQSGGG